MAAALAFQTEIRPHSKDLPFFASAWMLFLERHNISDFIYIILLHLPGSLPHPFSLHPQDPLRPYCAESSHTLTPRTTKRCSSLALVQVDSVTIVSPVVTSTPVSYSETSFVIFRKF